MNRSKSELIEAHGILNTRLLVLQYYTNVTETETLGWVGGKVSNGGQQQKQLTILNVNITFP